VPGYETSHLTNGGIVTLGLIQVAENASRSSWCASLPCSTGTMSLRESDVMKTDPKASTRSRAAGQRAQHSGAVFLVIASLLGVLLLLVDFEKEQLDLHEQTQAPLTEAAMILSETYDKEKVLMEKLRAVHNRLNLAIRLLDQAEQLDPGDKRQIGTLQARLRELDDTDRMRKMEPQALQSAYQDLTEQLNALASKLAGTTP